jgi:hypothetical protein
LNSLQVVGSIRPWTEKREVEKRKVVSNNKLRSS